MYTNKIGLTRGWLPQREGLPSLNSDGEAAAVPQMEECVMSICEQMSQKCVFLPSYSTASSHSVSPETETWTDNSRMYN